jgi:hypothetical protein
MRNEWHGPKTIAPASSLGTLRLSERTRVGDDLAQKTKTRLAINEAGLGASVFSSISELLGSGARNLEQIGAGLQYS